MKVSYLRMKLKKRSISVDDRSTNLIDKTKSTNSTFINNGKEKIDPNAELIRLLKK